MDSLALFVLSALQTTGPSATARARAPSAADVAAAARVLGASFTEGEIELMLADVRETLADFEALRAIPLDEEVQPVLHFLPAGRQQGPPLASEVAGDAAYTPPPWEAPPTRPVDLEDLAFAGIDRLHALLAAVALSAVELTELFLARLERLDQKLSCVVELLPERALAQARRLDEERAAGALRGPLHGIPWVAKDLLAVRGTHTTWGAMPFREQRIETDAGVVERLDRAGAVLIAKVSLGALAWGDVWFGGQTRNPWNLAQGSSGSSAGPASAVAAGCAVFGIGSETLGSIVSPSERCGNSSLRPTFGRIGRYGSMPLAWSMDKLGPMCRSARDAALVFAVLHGHDARDPVTVDRPFRVAAPSPVEAVRGWRVGILAEAFEDDDRFGPLIEELDALGVELVPVELPAYPVQAMTFVLSVEAATAFDTFSRGERDDLMVRQDRRAWPNVFRQAQLVPAVDYLRANRLRTLLIADWNRVFEEVRLLVHPSFAGDVLAATNLTGHPTFVAPCGFREDGTPFGVSFTGPLYDEEAILTLAAAWQARTTYHQRHPDL